MLLRIPEFALVALVGPSGSGKTNLARRLFKPTEVLSSDTFRGLVSDDELDQSATGDAFDALYFLARKRLARRRLTIIDATNVQPEARKPLVALAREYHCLPVAIVLNIDPAICVERNRSRADRSFGKHVVRNQAMDLKRSLRHLGREGFRHVFVLSTPEEVEAASIERQRLWTDRRDLSGPFDIVGDIHGCYDELLLLLADLGWSIRQDDDGSGPRLSHPEGRQLVFLGDLVDRGPKTPEVLRLAMNAVADGVALAVPGNHDMKLLKALRGKSVEVRHGLAASLAQLGEHPETFRQQVADFLDSLISHYELDGGRLVVAHAGMREDMQGRASGAVRAFALYGETSGETDELGLPVRYEWARDYRGSAMVVYGHTPVLEPEWLNRTLNIDTGCVFGERLTALRYPERELVSVPALAVYCEAVRPLVAQRTTSSDDDVLDLEDVSGRRILRTRLHGNVVVAAENATAALEAMSRFAVDPRWLIYLPPTMSPTETSREPALLEHPEEAFAYFEKAGVQRLVCEEKHMGSRAVLVVCRSQKAARRRFGVVEESGVCLSRTGRPFFSNPALEVEFVERVRQAMELSGLWDELATDWVCLDAELLPWSVKAQELLRQQYAPTGATGLAGLRAAVGLISGSSNSAINLTPLAAKLGERLEAVEHYVAAYQRYCWPVESIADLRLAPFHLMASEGAVHDDKEHPWHLERLGRLAQADPALIVATACREVDLGDPESRRQAVAWWFERTEAGSEGMVVKPRSFLARGRRGLAQPALKCRGREYLRIIYGPEYTAEENLVRLRERGVSRKRALAINEFALGLEALHRFVEKEPLRRVHECVFGVLALESEPVDPRL